MILPWQKLVSYACCLFYVKYHNQSETNCNSAGPVTHFSSSFFLCQPRAQCQFAIVSPARRTE